MSLWWRLMDILGPMARGRIPVLRAETMPGPGEVEVTWGAEATAAV